MILGELASSFELELEFVLIELLDEWVNTEGSRELSIYTIVHHEELSIGRIYNQCFQCFEVSQINTLVEIAVVQDGANTANASPTHLKIIV